MSSEAPLNTTRDVPRTNTLRGEFRQLFKLALPVAITQLGYMLFGVVDLLMVGRLDTESLSACVLGNSWVSGTLLIGMGLVFGMDPIVSQAHGAGDVRKLGRALQQGLVLALVASIPVALLWISTEQALLLFGQDPGSAALAQEYVTAQLPSIPFFLLFTALRQYLTGRGIVAPSLVVVLVANLLNALFDWALVFGNLGMPELGLVGAGITTSITRGSMLVMLAIWIMGAKLHHGAWVPWSRSAFKFSGLSEIIRHGVPIALYLSLEIWAFQIATYMAGWFEVTDLAAHGIVMNIASLSFMVPLGVSIGTVTRVGNLIGAGDPVGAQRTAWAATLMGGLAMSLCALTFLLFPTQILGLYTNQAAVITAAAAILPLAAFFQVFDGIQVVGCGVMRGMGRTRPAAVFNLIAYYGLALPIAWWLAFRSGMGLSGIWWGLFIGLAAVAAMLMVWIKRSGPATATIPSRTGEESS